MILFYSEHCPHCRMLLDTIKRHDVEKIIKQVSIEALKSSGKTVPPAIHAVPALMITEERKLMFGKAVFDYLLLPGSGVLLTMQAKRTEAMMQPHMPGGGAAPSSSDEGPYAFVLGSGTSDTYSPYDDTDENSVAHDRIHSWTPLNDAGAQPAALSQEMPMQEETRCKITLPDIKFIQQQREMDLRGEAAIVNLSNMPPATPTRIV